MLDAIKKKLGMSPSIKEEVDMTVDNKAPVELSSDMEAVVAELSTIKASFAEQATQVASLMTQLEAAQTALAEVEAAKAALATEAKNKQLEARKQRVEAAIGEAKAPAMLTATEQLDDAQFEAIVSAMAASFDAEADSPAFKEAGVSAKAEAPEVEESLEMKIIKAKQSPK